MTSSVTLRPEPGSGLSVPQKDVLCQSSTLVPPTELSSRQSRDPSSSFVLASSHSNLRLLCGSFEGSKFPGSCVVVLKVQSSEASV